MTDQPDWATMLATYRAARRAMTTAELQRTLADAACRAAQKVVDAAYRPIAELLERDGEETTP